MQLVSAKDPNNPTCVIKEGQVFGYCKLCHYTICERSSNRLAAEIICKRPPPYASRQPSIKQSVAEARNATIDFKETKQRLTHANYWSKNNNPEWREFVDQTVSLNRQAQHNPSDKMEHDYANDRTRLSGLFQPNNEVRQPLQETDSHINKHDQLLILTPPEGDSKKRIRKKKDHMRTSHACTAPI